MPQREQQRRVFVVDDESVIASTVAMILRHYGYDAIPFTEPAEALKAARLEPPGLLISDIVMPLQSGIDLAIEIQALSPRCKVLLFSGQASVARLMDAAKARGKNFEVLSKPIHPKDLLYRIEQVTRE
jgi:DNA-binding NtrC family response regulator